MGICCVTHGKHSLQSVHLVLLHISDIWFLALLKGSVTSFRYTAFVYCSCICLSGTEFSIDILLANLQGRMDRDASEIYAGLRLEDVFFYDPNNNLSRVS